MGGLAPRLRNHGGLPRGRPLHRCTPIAGECGAVSYADCFWGARCGHGDGGNLGGMCTPSQDHRCVYYEQARVRTPFLYKPPMRLADEELRGLVLGLAGVADEFIPLVNPRAFMATASPAVRGKNLFDCRWSMACLEKGMCNLDRGVCRFNRAICLFYHREHPDACERLSVSTP